MSRALAFVTDACARGIRTPAGTVGATPAGRGRGRIRSGSQRCRMSVTLTFSEKWYRKVIQEPRPPLDPLYRLRSLSLDERDPPGPQSWALVSRTQMVSRVPAASISGAPR